MPRAPVGGDPRRHRPDRLIGEVGEQPGEPPGRRQAIGVEEGDERGARRPPSGVAGGRRSSRRVVADDGHPVCAHRRRHGPDGHLRTVVDDHDGSGRLERLQGLGQTAGSIANRDHDRDVGGGRAGARRWAGVGDPGVEQAAGQRPPARARPIGSPAAQASTRAAPAVRSRRTRMGWPPTRISGRGRRTAGSRARPNSGGGSGAPLPAGVVTHRAVMPASTGSTAPVMPLLSGPHSQAMRAAGSSGVRSRGRRCWAANSAGPASP